MTDVELEVIFFYLLAKRLARNSLFVSQSKAHSKSIRAQYSELSNFLKHWYLLIVSSKKISSLSFHNLTDLVHYTPQGVLRIKLNIFSLWVRWVKGEQRPIPQKAYFWLLDFGNWIGEDLNRAKAFQFGFRSLPQSHDAFFVNFWCPCGERLSVNSQTEAPCR